jgi:hypothetical protein
MPTMMEEDNPSPPAGNSQTRNNTVDEVTVVGAIPPLARAESDMEESPPAAGKKVVTEVSKLVAHANSLAGLYMPRKLKDNMLCSCFTIV